MNIKTQRVVAAAAIISIAMSVGLTARPQPSDKKPAAELGWRQAAKDMLKAAQSTSKLLTDIERIRARRAAGSIDIYLLWGRRIMGAKLKLAAAPKQRVGAIREYLAFCRDKLKRVTARIALDATVVDILRVKYAVAEAQYLLAEALDGKASPDKKQAAKDMLKTAEAEVRSVKAMYVRNSGPRMLDMLRLLRRSHRRVMVAKLKLAEAPNQRVEAIREYLDYCRKQLVAVKRRAKLDATKLDVAGGEHAVAKAKYLLAEELGPKNLSDKKQAAKDMLKAAETRLAAQSDMMKIKGRADPELMLDWGRRVMDAKLKLAETKEQKIEAISQYAAFCKKQLDRISGRRLIPPPPLHKAAAEYAVAEAAYLLARKPELKERSPSQATQPAKKTPSSRKPGR